MSWDNPRLHSEPPAPFLWSEKTNIPKNPIGFDRAPAPKIEVVKAVPIEDLKAYHDAINELRRRPGL